MPGDRCVVCKNSRIKDPDASFHRFPVDPTRRATWLRELHLEEHQAKPHAKVCCRHFPGGDAKLAPRLTLGKRFASPVKRGTARAKRATARKETQQLLDCFLSLSPSPCSSRSVTPVPSLDDQPASKSSSPSVSELLPLTAGSCEPLDANCDVYELPSESQPETSTSSIVRSTEGSLVNTVLAKRIDALVAENCQLKKQLQQVTARQYFRIEHIQNDDALVKFYTGFTSFMVFQAFYDFLGPAVNELNYWGAKDSQRCRNRRLKLNPKNQLFLLLVKLRLNLKTKDLAYRFGLSVAAVSRYLTTWICFTYQHLSEIDWMPSVEQVMGTLPHTFKEKYPSTFAIIDGSEIFMETPSDLHMQSSTWSQYKHHNTAKFLVACTPNGAISYISPLFVGSILDVELTRVSGFLTKLEDKPGISIMADRGFVIKDLLDGLGVSLNIPPFLEGRTQLSAGEVREGRKIASLRIHVERAIGRIKNFSILSETLPISLARLANQIVCVCGYLTNFQPALVPPPVDMCDTEVEEYFGSLPDSDNEDYSTNSDSDD